MQNISNIVSRSNKNTPNNPSKRKQSFPETFILFKPVLIGTVKSICITSQIVRRKNKYDELPIVIINALIRLLHQNVQH